VFSVGVLILYLVYRVYILGTGTIKWMGTMQELRSHPEVLESYLGV
jgi:ABC-type branched-subunit amino acid transport system ATPase component